MPSREEWNRNPHAKEGKGNPEPVGAAGICPRITLATASNRKGYALSGRSRGSLEFLSEVPLLTYGAGLEAKRR